MKKKKKILFIPASVPEEKGGKFSGGAANVFWNLASSLSKNVDAYLYPIHNFKRKKINNVSIIPINKTKIYLTNLLPSSIYFNKYLKKALKYKIKKPLIFAISQSIKETHLKKIIKKINPDLVHISGLYKRDFIFESVKKIPTILTLQGIGSNDKECQLKEKYNRKLIKTFLENEKHTITGVSKKVVRKLKNKYNVKNAKYILTAGISKEFFNKKRTTQNNTKKKTIIYVGNLNKRKNVILALKSMKNIPDINFRIIGEGPELKSLKKYKKENKLNNVQFIERIPHKKTIKEYLNSNFLILTSLSEGLASVFLEALSTGNKIITMKNLDGVEDIYNKDCFELIDDYSVKSVEKTIKKALKKPVNEKKIINYAKKFLWDKTAKGYLKEFKQVLKNYKE